jgi:hypothetical protein
MITAEKIAADRVVEMVVYCHRLLKKNHNLELLELSMGDCIAMAALVFELTDRKRALETLDATDLPGISPQK